MNDLKDAIRVHLERERLNPASKILADTIASSKEKEEKEIKLFGPSDTCTCGKQVPVTSFPLMHSGVFQFPNNVCRGCKEAEKLDKETSRIVCVKCKRVVARIKPVKEKSGFVYAPGVTYHTDACPECKPNLTESTIVEKVIYMNKTQRSKQ